MQTFANAFLILIALALPTYAAPTLAEQVALLGKAAIQQAEISGLMKQKLARLESQIDTLKISNSDLETKVETLRIQLNALQTDKIDRH